MLNQLKQMLNRAWPFSRIHRSSTSEQQEVTSTDGGTESTDLAGEESEQTGPGSQLYECPDCRQVYVAIDKDICSRCEAEVKAVARSWRY